ncbi:family 43 glycosylhydrolase [Gracilibacillus sp. HCP3S3_G5_1]|uniref:family 43 glycosylhydrolase n=1 Tax=unclassified Gracilibacillus TaxID=2625209 RepID=UPI003F8C13EE
MTYNEKTAKQILGLVSVSILVLLALSIFPSTVFSEENQEKDNNNVSVVSEGGELLHPQTDKIPLTGQLSTHDPTLFKDGDTYYAFSTHQGAFRSEDGMEGPWESFGRLDKPEWTYEVSNGTTWAPHVHKVDDMFYMYYSISNFGTNNSAIGVAYTETPGDLDSWVDHGEAIISSGEAGDGETHNAIDPAILQDNEGQWWIVWGSHFDGIMIQRLKDNMVETTGEIYPIAHRGSERFPVTNPSYNRIEGPAIFKRGDYYYLLSGWDWCCRADPSDNTYKIVVGRSENINGPYVDKTGTPLTEGGGNIILNHRYTAPGITPDGLYQAPGGPDVYVENDSYYMIYHGYMPQTRMGIREMQWHDDWPYFSDPGNYNLQDGLHYQIKNEESNKCLAVATDGNVIQTECDNSFEQTWKLNKEHDGFYQLESMANGGQYCLELENNSGVDRTNIHTSPCKDTDNDLQQWYFDDMGYGYHRIGMKDINLALEIDHVEEGEYLTNVAGWYPRNGDHSFGSATQAGKWPPQHWMLTIMDSNNIISLIDYYTKSNDITGPFKRQLTNSAKQAQHHFENGNNKQASKHLENFLKRIDNEDLQDQISPHAKAILREEVNEFIQVLH